MKKLILTTLVAVLGCASFNSYAITCTKSGYVERVNTAATSTVYVRVGNNLTGTLVSAITADIKLISAANSALTSRTWVTIVTTTTATTCPASGAIGSATSLIVAP